MNQQDMMSLGDALPREIERVQKIIRIYEETPNGQFAAALMRADIETAHRAMMEGDVVRMITVWQSLKEWKL